MDGPVAGEGSVINSGSLDYLASVPDASVEDWSLDWSAFSWLKVLVQPGEYASFGVGENGVNGFDLFINEDNGGAGEVQLSDSSYLAVSDPLSPGVGIWVLVGLTWTQASKTLRLYTDGNFVGEDVAVLVPGGPDAANYVFVGASDSSVQIGPSGIYRNRVLTAVEFALIATGLPFDDWT